MLKMQLSVEANVRLLTMHHVDVVKWTLLRCTDISLIKRNKENFAHHQKNKTKIYQPTQQI